MISQINREEKFEKGRLIHQYYRDVLSQNYVLPELGQLSQEWLSKILSTGNYDLLLNVEELFNKTDNGSKRHAALRLMLMIIFQANLVLDINNHNKNYCLPRVFNKSIINAIEKLLKLNVHEGYLVTSMQILYRIGEYEIFNYLAEINRSVFNSSTVLLKIKAMIHSFSEDYETSKLIISQLSDHDKKTMPISILDITCDYKLSLPSSFVYQDKNLNEPNIENFSWLKKPQNNNKGFNRVFVAFDKQYYFKHVSSLIKSILFTNKNNLFLHVHLYNPDNELISAIETISKKYPDLDISSSYEIIKHCKNIKTYYASRRFVALYFVRKEINNNLIAIDADSLFYSLWSIKPKLKNKKIICINPMTIPFWEKIPASFLFFSKSDLSSEFLLKTAKLLEANLYNGSDFWFTDQIVLSIVLDSLIQNYKDDFGYLNIEQVCDTEHKDYSIIWQLSTDKENGDNYNKYKDKLEKLVC